MKNLILVLLGLSLSSMLSAQISAGEYMKRVPAIPVKVCQLNGIQQDAFITQVRNLSKEIETDAQKRSKASQEYMEANTEQMKANMIKSSGMSDEEIKKLQSGKEMSEAEKMEMANRMMQQKTNISMDEAKNVKNMSKEGQEAWAQGYAAEQMAVAQTNPQQNKAEQSKNMKAYELLEEQSSLRNKIGSMENTIRQQYQALDREAETEKQLLEKELKPLYDELNSINDGEGSTQADVDHAARVIKQIQAKQDKFCEKFTPRMLDFLAKSRESYKTALPDYERAEQIQCEVTAAQTGTPVMTAGRGAYSIQAVGQFLGYLGEAFRYKLYRTDK
jgi:hypothetical protein